MVVLGLSTVSGVAFWQPAPLQTLEFEAEERKVVTRVPGTGVSVEYFRRGVDFEVLDEIAFIEGRRVVVERVLAGRVLADLAIEDLVVCIVVRDERLLLAVGLDFVVDATVAV